MVVKKSTTKTLHQGVVTLPGTQCLRLRFGCHAHNLALAENGQKSTFSKLVVKIITWVCVVFFLNKILLCLYLKLMIVWGALV